jgi:hypothetical protein
LIFQHIPAPNPQIATVELQIINGLGNQYLGGLHSHNVGFLKEKGKGHKRAFSERSKTIDWQAF